jgi:hypothetical protein
LLLPASSGHQSSATKLTPTAFVKMLTELSLVDTVCICGFPLLTHEHLREVVESNPRIKKIYLKHCTGVHMSELAVAVNRLNDMRGADKQCVVIAVKLYSEWHQMNGQFNHELDL